MRYIDEQAIERITLGATLLGTGGGGDPYIGKMMALQAVRRYGPVALVAADELSPDELVVPISMIGAPTVLWEKIPSGREMVKILELMEAHLGKRAAAVMPIEIGGVNSLIPIAVAAEKSLPVVDADAMGRAFPEAQMVSFYLDGLVPNPVTMADEKGNTVLFHPVDAVWSERLARSLTVQMGASAAMSDYALTAGQVLTSGILGTLSLAEEVGRLILEARRENRSPVQDLLDTLHGFRLFTGKISDVTRRLEGGFTKGEAILEALTGKTGESLSLYFQNEYLLAASGDRILASTPDLIVALDADVGTPITSDRLKYGMRVDILAFPAPPKWRTPKGIEVAGPRYFGYDVDYVPVEHRVAAAAQ
ncbi:DUF917 domain-containing protein [Kyrpidia sp.]|uniref:DUF917 domain-containing protein n=1 Tax=Kyrpidia sp. TaxID=2073077 RepID=UPI002583F144|nr:DUF917 domain-containing protein [Kyrpidia sp.]MCL6577459.1 DUF917 domain-containing protein [Kyrpidia sp.]